jgi:hypothetical protein
MHWHIARCLSGQDIPTADSLRARCYLVYNPVCHRRVRLSHGRFTRRLAPMFPGILLVDPGAQSWERLRTTPGILTSDPLFKNDGHYAVLPPELFDEIRCTELKKMAPLELPPAYQIGEEVRVTDGPWSGYFGPVDRLDGDGAVRLLLDVFSRKTPVSIPLEYLAPAENSGLCAAR